MTNFVGVRTNVSLLTDIAHLSGTVELPPVERSFHAEAVEFAGTLKAVEDMRDGSFSVAEIGAGWGPWVLTAAKAAQLRGATDVYMTAIEADEGHVSAIYSQFRDNGFDPEQHRIIRGAVAPQDGFAYFPSPQEREDWGAAAIFTGLEDDAEVTDYRGVSLHHAKLPAYSLATVLSDREIFDLVHVDIQGSERIVLPGAMETLNAKVRWLVIGTHSRIIEGQLLELFSNAGWQLINEAPCRFQMPPVTMPISEVLTFQDGTQVWLNSRLQREDEVRPQEDED